MASFLGGFLPLSFSLGFLLSLCIIPIVNVGPTDQLFGIFMASNIDLPELLGEDKPATCSGLLEAEMAFAPRRRLGNTPTVGIS